MSDILYEKHGSVVLISINRPEKMNSLNFEANDELVSAWERFDQEEDALVAVVTGKGAQSFCAGADLKTYTMAFANTSAPEFRKKYTNGPGFGGITRNLHQSLQLSTDLLYQAVLNWHCPVIFVFVHPTQNLHYKM